MKKGLKILIKTALTTIGILAFFTAAFICLMSIIGIDYSALNLDQLFGARSSSELKDWYYGEIGDIVVGEATVVESISYDRYAYQQLDEITQQVYDQVLECINNHDEKITLSTTDVNTLTVAYEAVMADYGGLFWTNGYQYNTYKSGDRIVGLEFAPKYTMSKEQRDIYQGTIDATVEQWLAGISVEDNDFDKALYVFEKLISNVDYDLDSVENQNILSVFINRVTVCQGYADAAWYMLDKLGIKSTIITGRANGEAHAWNLVYLDGAYYYMDVTWGNSRYLNLDASTQKRVNYAYLAMTTEELAHTHTIDTSFEMPQCLSNADNYYVYKNLYFDSFDVNSIGWTLQKSYEAGDSESSIKLANPELFNEVAEYFFEDKHIADYCSGINSIYYIMDDNANVITIQW